MKSHRPLSATLAAFALVACGDAPPHETVSSTAAALDAVPSFGTNPGNLLMYRYAPAGAPTNAPLVVVLHGCTETAADIAAAGWSTLADQYKFYVVYPQQQTANNPAQCFDWFGQYNQPANKANITRGQGENLSIKQMVDRMKADFSIDGQRVYVAGFSSGGAMAAVMLAAWPDVFAAGGIDAGVPYDCPSTTNPDVWSCMNPGKTQTAAAWAQAVKGAYPGYSGPYPRVTIWQGTQDTTVGTANSAELVKQWTEVHGLSGTPTSSDTVDGYPHDVFADAAGRVQVERYQITGMGHGMAVDPSHGCGAASQYAPDEHICTADHMLQFFGVGPQVALDAGLDDAAPAPADAATTDAAPVDASIADATPPPDASRPDTGAITPVDAGKKPDAASTTPPPAPSGTSADAGMSAGGSGIAGCDVAARGEPTPFAPLAALAAAAALALRRRRRA